MKRRELLAHTAAAAGVCTVGAVAPAIATGAKKLKMVTSWPADLPGLGDSAKRFAETLTAASGGRLAVEVFGAGTLVNAFEVFDAVSSGIADMYHSAEYYWQKQSPAFAFFTAVPFGLTAAEMNAWVYEGGGQTLWDELSAQFSIKPLLVANTGVQMGGWFNKEVNSTAAFEGLRFRMPGLGGEVLRRLGATVVNLPGGQIVPSLQSGAIDASEWVGPWNDMMLGVHTAGKYYYYPGFHEPGTALSLGVNKGVWDGLSAEEKALVRTAAAAENAYSVAQFNARNTSALEELVTKHNVQVRKFDDAILTAFGKLSGEVLEEVSARDPFTKRVYESFLGFRRSVMRWGDMSERGYLNARGLDYPFGRRA